MAFGRNKGDRKAPDGKFYQPDDPIWETFQRESATVVDELSEQTAAEEALAAMAQNPPPQTSPPLEASGSAAARKEVANYGNPQNPLATASNEFLDDLKVLVEHHKAHTAQVTKGVPSVPEAEKMADAQAADLVRQVDAEKRRRAKMSPEAFAASGLPPISSMILHMRADPSVLTNAKGERPCEKDEIIHWVSTDNAETNRSDDPQWVLAMTASGSQLIYDENGSPQYRHGCVAMKCKAERSAHRKAFALEGKSQYGIREAQQRDHDQIETSRHGGIISGAMQTQQRGMVDPFDAARMRPGEMNIPIS